MSLAEVRDKTSDTQTRSKIQQDYIAASSRSTRPLEARLLVASAFGTTAMVMRLFDNALRLAHGMTYKNALADLSVSGGKSVIIGDKNTCDRESIFRAHGYLIDLLAGKIQARRGDCQTA